MPPIYRCSLVECLTCCYVTRFTDVRVKIEKSTEQQKCCGYDSDKMSRYIRCVGVYIMQ